MSNFRLLPAVDLDVELILSIKDADLGVSGAASMAGRLQLYNTCKQVQSIGGF